MAHERLCCKPLLNILKYSLLLNMLFIYIYIYIYIYIKEKFLPGSDGELSAQLMGCFSPTHHKMYQYWWTKIKRSVLCLGWLLAAVTCLHSFSHIALDSTWKSTSSGGGSAALDWEDASGRRYIYQSNSVLYCTSGSPLLWLYKNFISNIWLPNLPVHLIMYGSWLSERPTKLHLTPKMNWRQG